MASDKHVAMLKEGTAAWNKWRREEPLVRPELQGLSLTLAQKQWGETSGGPINLAKSVLREADLRHATLIRADMAGALLSGANLSGARLQNADLRNANLSRARFDDANLEGALLGGADLRGADLSSARNLSAEQLEVASGDSKTLLPPQLVAPKTWWANGAYFPLSSDVSVETLKAAVEENSPKAPRRRLLPQPKAAVDLAKQALGRMPDPRRAVDHAKAAFGRLPNPKRAVDRTRAALPKLPNPGLAVARAKAALPKMPDPRLATERVRAALPRLPKPRVVVDRVRAALRNMPQPRLAFDFAGNSGRRVPEHKLLLAAGLAGLAGVAFVVVIGRLVLDRNLGPAAPNEPPAVVADAGTGAQESPQRLSVSEPAPAPPVQDVGQSEEVSTVPAPWEQPAAPRTDPLAVTAAPATDVRQPAHNPALAVQEPPAQPAEQAPVADRAPEAGQAPEKAVRLAFAGEKPTNTQNAGGAAEAFIESYAGQVAATPPVRDAAKRTDLPLPKPEVKKPEARKPEVRKPEVKKAEVKKAEVKKAEVKKAEVKKPEVKTAAIDPSPPAPEPPAAPATVVDYLSAPSRTSEWIVTFIRDFYLSTSELKDWEIRSIYSGTVKYYGKNVSVDRLAGEMASYYKQWPQRQYDLIPGSIAIKWTTPDIADVSFSYRFKVSAPNKKANSGRGRAHLTLDLRGSKGLITREDGEILK